MGLGALLVCLFLVVADRGFRFSEPEFEGRTLSIWLHDLKDLHEDRSHPARLAVQRIGTNAIPRLVERLQRRETHGELLLDSLSGFLKRGQPLHIAIETKRSEALCAFEVLGTNAVGALPSLCQLLTNTTTMMDEVVAISIGHSLAAVGEVSKYALLAALSHSNRNVRAAALIGLSDLGPAAKDLLPSVKGQLNDPDAEIRQLALYFVSRFIESGEEQQRILSAALLDSNPDVRRFAKREIERHLMVQESK